MTDITVTAAKVAVVYPDEAEIFTGILVEAATEGQALYQTSAGKYGLCDADLAAKCQFRGIALEKGGAGQAISILRCGHVSGYTLTGVAYDGLAYLSNTAGAIADAVGTITVNVGRCVPLPDNSLTKVLFVHADWLRNWTSS